ncbi:MAG: A24 family peptidase [Candidatus Diapherotrites archaeon]
MELLLFREIVLIAATGIAAWTDLRTGLINDWLTYPLIAIGAIFGLLEFDWTAFGLAAVVFAIGYALYYFGKFGGGDVKLFTGIALVLPFFQGQLFILNVVIVSALVSFVALPLYFVPKYFSKGFEWAENRQRVLESLLIGVVLLFYFYFLASSGLVSVEYALGLGLPIAFALVFVAFEKGIKKKVFLRKVKLGELDEDELVAVEELDEKTRNELKMGLKAIIGEKEKAKLKEMGINEVPVYRNLPRFGPFIFIGTVLLIAFPQLANFFLKGF